MTDTTGAAARAADETPSTALITGATAGIGAEFARQLAAEGRNLVIVARDRGRLDALAAELSAAHGISVEVLVADLLEADQLAAVERRLASADHPIDYLVSNAGFGLPREFDENTVDEELRQFDILARVPLVLAHAALGAMLVRGSGTILTVASTAGFLPLGSYSAAKSWAITFSRWANAYYRSAGVTFTALAPGFVRTEFHARMNVEREAMAPGFMWFDVDKLVRDARRDASRGRAVSVPTVRYKLIVGAATLLRPFVTFAVARRGRARRANSHPG